MAKSSRILVLIGTRPEAIKLFPVISALKQFNAASIIVGATGQHRELLDQVFSIAEIKPDFDLSVMTPNQSLDELSARLITGIGTALDRIRPDRIVVQGDTTTAMSGALAAYYRRIPVSHVEAGLRSDDNYAPWPEEVNRKIITTIADQHFAPTIRAARALRKENVDESRIHVTGNTVVDALLMTKAMLDRANGSERIGRVLSRRFEGLKQILVTCHRRENFGAPLERIAESLVRILERPDVALCLPVHPNPNVRHVLTSRIADHPRAAVIPAQDYVEFVSLLDAADIVLTDSGGVQEEAPSLGKPTLVMRDTTERPEGVEAGATRLVGADTQRIVDATMRLLDDPSFYESMARAQNPFGDGHASQRIAKVVLQ